MIDNDETAERIAAILAIILENAALLDDPRAALSEEKHLYPSARERALLIDFFRNVKFNAEKQYPFFMK